MSEQVQYPEQAYGRSRGDPKELQHRRHPNTTLPPAIEAADEPPARRGRRRPSPTNLGREPPFRTNALTTGKVHLRELNSRENPTTTDPRSRRHREQDPPATKLEPCAKTGAPKDQPTTPSTPPDRCRSFRPPDPPPPQIWRRTKVHESHTGPPAPASRRRRRQAPKKLAAGEDLLDTKPTTSRATFSRAPPAGSPPYSTICTGRGRGSPTLPPPKQQTERRNPAALPARTR